ncbi:copper chaperone PCu(A)C [Lacibacterium aquatile]|uniref:Copper chaperone PCu(A)C n=1 Tax=Lacibacterium aquatile TaxID=1168082 RepID=A0ABW5DQQ7_9PROT
MRILTGLLAATLLATPVFAHEYKAGAILVDHPFARAVTSAQKTASVYMTLKNEGAADRLVEASTPVAKSVDAHINVKKGEVITMQHLDAIDVPAGQTVELNPRAPLHLMLMDLKQPLKVGEKFPMTLRFEKAGTVDVIIHIEKPGAMDAGAHHAH